MSAADEPVNGDSGPLVSIIIPAWNSEATLLQTLQSAGAQTHRNVEILIVDDGATDRTAEIAADYCAQEGRARLIRKQNGGLASARNRGIEEATGEFIAPLDADDIWHPEKLERQLQTFAERTAKVALVYCWYRMIDADGLVTQEPWAPVFEGEVFADHLQCSFGTGSSPLIRSSALGSLRYDERLGKAGNPGSEDWLLQLQIAAGWEIACTKAFLVGYRAAPGNMSSDAPRMMRSHIHMLEVIRRSMPDRESGIVRRELGRWHARHGVAELRRRPLAAAREIAVAVACSPLVAGKTLALEFGRRTRFAASRPLDAHPSVGKPFLTLSPDDL